MGSNPTADKSTRLEMSNFQITKFRSPAACGAHAVVVSRLLRMQKALGSNPSGSIFITEKEFGSIYFR